MHRAVARQDIRHATRVIQALDSRWNIWGSPDDEKKDQEKEVRNHDRKYILWQFAGFLALTVPQILWLIEFHATILIEGVSGLMSFGLRI